jgi:hypothetical protein
VVRQRRGEVVPQIPAQTEPVGDDPQQLPFGPQPLEEQNQVQLEEDDRIDRRPADPGVGPADQIADEGEIEGALQVPIEMVRRNHVVEGHRR